MLLSPLTVLLSVFSGEDTTSLQPVTPPALTSAPRAAEFLENRGQWDARTLFRGRVGNQCVSFDRDGVRVFTPGADRTASESSGLCFGLRIESAGDAMVVEGADPAAGTRDRIVGPDPSCWQTGLRAYHEVVYRQVKDGIDLRFHDHDGALKYDVLVAPGADLDGLVLIGEGADSLGLEPDGGLAMSVAGELVVQPSPVSYVCGDEGPAAVEARFRILGDQRFGFAVPGWDGADPLVIDPGLKVSTFLGGSLGDIVFAMEIAPNGDVVLAGETYDLGFPTTPGAYRGSGLKKEGFLSRLDPSGSTLLHSTFLGGSGDDSIFDLFLDDQGIATFGGWTRSLDLPTTAGAFQKQYRGGTADAFVGRIAVQEGAVPLALTYFGTLQNEQGLQVLMDATMGIYLAGITDSSNLPTIPFNSFDPSYNGAVDAFVARLSLDGKSLLSSTYLGGSSADAYYNAYFLPLKLAHVGNALYVASETYSADFPVTPGLVQDTWRGLSDNFVTMLTDDLTGMIQSTYIGGINSEYLTAMQVLDNGDVVVGGYTTSTTYPITSNAYDKTYNGSAPQFVETFVTVLKDDFTAYKYSTFLGGIGHDMLRDLVVEPSGIVALVGISDSIDFPITPNAYDTTKNGPTGGIAGQDGFLVRLDTTAGINGLVYSTWLGGTSQDLAKFVRLGAVEGDYYLAGDTNSSDFPITAGAYDSTHDGSLDGWFARLCLSNWSNYGQGLAGTGGVPLLTLDKDPVQGTTVTFSLDNSAGVPTFGLAFLGTAANPASGGNPGELHVDPLLWQLVPLTIGTNQWPWSVPTADAYCGLPVHLQVLELDAGAPKGISFTPALKMLIGG